MITLQFNLYSVVFVTVLLNANCEQNNYGTSNPKVTKQVCQMMGSDATAASSIQENTQMQSDSGGWDSVATTPGLDLAGPCTVDVRYACDLTQDEFLSRYASSHPVVIKGAFNNDRFRSLTRRPALLSRMGSSTVRLSSANTFSYDKLDMKFEHYCNEHMAPQGLNVRANETFYMFGDHTNPAWLLLLDQYSIPNYVLPNHSPMLSFGVAGPGSGVPFHFHGPGFAETMWGRKRWFLSPPDSPPTFNPNRTTLQWLQEDRVPQEDLVECTINPGELIYFPDRWWHATLNVDASVFVSTFLSP